MEVVAVVLIPKDLPVVKTLVAQTESSRAVDIVARSSSSRRDPGRHGRTKRIKPLAAENAASQCNFKT